MFDIDYFFELCELYGVEVREGMGGPLIYQNGQEVPLTAEMIVDGLGSSSNNFRYETTQSFVKVSPQASLGCFQSEGLCEAC